MKNCRVLGVLCVMLMFAAASWAGGQPASSGDTPVILASLDAGNATILDDSSAAAVRGGEGFQYKYVLVKILGVNALDAGPGVQWTWNPLGYRYGAWGGPGWTNGGLATGDAPVADTMDSYFRLHDLAYNGGQNKLAADQILLAALLGLPNSPNAIWGPIYVNNPTGLNVSSVYVSGLSLVGGKIFFGWKPMPYTEYARREAVAGLGVMVLGRSLISAIRLQ